MYAKLVFPTGTDYTKINRDIVRAINNSDGSGGSTVAALEFVTAASSTIEDTVASDWSLASGQTLGTGSSSVEQDKQMYLQQTHANTSTITVSLQTAFRDSTSGTFTQANNVTYSGVSLCPVSDYSESYEAIIGGTATGTNPAGGPRPWSCITGPEVHIIARDGLIMIAGTKTGYDSGHSFQAIAEVDGHETRKGRNRPAVAYLIGGEYSASSMTSFDNPNADTDWADITGSGHFTDDHSAPIYLTLVDALYDFEDNAEIRCWTAYRTSLSNSLTTSTPSSNLWIYNAAMVQRDTSQSNGFGSLFTNSTSSYRATRVMGKSSNQWSNEMAFNWHPVNTSNTQGGHLETPKKLDGTEAVFLRPSMPVLGFACQQWDLSTKGGYYTSTGNFPGRISVVDDGTDEYLAVKSFRFGACGVAFRK